MPKRPAALSIVGLVACGAVAAKSTKTAPTAAPVDAGSAWEGDGCITLASPSAPLDVPNAVLDGDLYKGRDHCYLDLQRALCVRVPGDAGLEEVYVRSLRIAGSCENQREVRLRGSVRGRIEPLTPLSTIDWSVDAQPTSIERAEHKVDVELDDPSAARMELLKSFMVHCWRNASFASPTGTGHVAFEVAVSATGEVTDVRKKDAVATSEAFEACVVKSVRAPQMFLAADAGASRNLGLRITFSVAVSPIR